MHALASSRQGASRPTCLTRSTSGGQPPPGCGGNVSARTEVLALDGEAVVRRAVVGNPVAADEVKVAAASLG